MPEGVEIKAKITKGGKGAKKRKAGGSVSCFCARQEKELIYRMTTRLVLVDRVTVRRKRSPRLVRLVRRPLLDRNCQETKRSRQRSPRVGKERRRLKRMPPFVLPNEYPSRS